MPNELLAFLSLDYAGLILALPLLAVGLWLVLRHRWRRTAKGAGAQRKTGRRWPGVLLLIAGGVLAGGSIKHLSDIAQAWRDFPPPGRFVTVDGTSIHVLAQGPKSARPTLVWFAGGHVPGLAIDHLHRRVRGNFRSVLIDRPGTGWSGPGKFPRSTVREAQEMWAALEAAGEKGPFVLIGHSFGGLLAANMARSHPERVKSLVLLDATPPDTIIYGPKLGGLAKMRSDALWGGLFALVGLDYQKIAGDAPTGADRLDRIIARELGQSYAASKALGRSPAFAFTSYSIYSELSPTGLADVAWDTVVYDGELSPMPVFLMAPRDLLEFGKLPEAANAKQREAARMARFFASTRERYLASSTNAQRIYAPAGTGHNFPYEAPDLVVATVMRAAAQ